MIGKRVNFVHVLQPDMTLIRDVNPADGAVVHQEPVVFSLDFEKYGQDVRENSAMHDDSHAVIRAPMLGE